MREQLRQLSTVLRECGAQVSAARIEDAISGSEQEMDVFLTSNELWGGAGSIADQAGKQAGSRTDCSRKIESALVQLGKEQIRAGKVNPRTAMWVSTFEQWEKAGI
jgi:trimethylamine:corrinoid methyltransferase-like protein